MKAWHVFVGFFLLLALGCGGGGGGGVTTPSTVNINGQVLWIETGAATDPATTVRIGNVSAQTDLIDGYFSLDVPLNSSSLTATYSGTGTPVVQTFTFDAATADTYLGDLYIGPETVTVRGTVVDSSSSSPVPGAKVSIAGKNATTNSSGLFSITGVAYSSTNQAVFFGLQGVVSSTNYFDGYFSPSSSAAGGIVDVGTVSVTPKGSTTPPGLPYNVSGALLPTGSGGGATVVAKVGTSVIRTTTADVTGTYKMWLPAGTYTIEATKGASSGTATLTVTNVNQLVTKNVTLN